MKSNYIKKGFYILLASLSLSSCFDDDFPGVEQGAGSVTSDTNIYQGEPDSIRYYKDFTEEEVKAAESMTRKVVSQLPIAQYALRGGKEGGAPEAHQYQYQYSLYTDNFVGYFSLPHNFDNRISSTYFYSVDFNSGPNGSYINVKNAVVPILHYPGIDSIPEIKAMALLLYDYAAIDAVDVYGPIPYTDYKFNKQSSPYTYNTVEYVYKTVVQNLDDIVACFDSYKSRPDWYKKIIQKKLNDVDYLSPMENWDLENWRRLANSLKLRIAIHVSKVDPVLAQQWGEEAVASGVIESLDQQMALRPGEYGGEHPLATISESWNDTRLGASYESIMKSFNHPYLDRIFTKNTWEIPVKQFYDQYGQPILSSEQPLPADSRVVGLRAGILLEKGQGQVFRTGYSKLVNDNELKYMPMYVMKLSEVLFLRAEGALRKWNMGGGSPGSYYEQGVRNAFPDGSFAQEYAAFVDGYLQQNAAYPYTYVDPYNNRYNAESLTNIGVKWNDSDTDELKLEKIITQKYIAIFPDSHEAWVDLRRTGYPQIFPVIYDEGDGSIPVGGMIRRLIFPGKNDVSVATDIEATGITALGGADQQNTRIWWDIQGMNF